MALIALGVGFLDAGGSAQQDLHLGRRATQTEELHRELLRLVADRFVLVLSTQIFNIMVCLHITFFLARVHYYHRY